MPAHDAAAYVEAVESLNLDTTLIGLKLKAFGEIDSTNTYVLEHGTPGMVVVADRQTHGRGRQGRTWFSAPGLGLWFTACLGGRIPGLTFAAGLAVHDVLAGIPGVSLKWPNDVLIHGKKVCGILAEHRAGITALGIGINVHHVAEDFPEELRDRASSLEAESGQPFDRVDLLGRVLTQLDRSVMLLRDGSYEQVRTRWVAACDIVGKTVVRGETTGIVTEIDADGALLMDTADGPVRILSGDITIAGGDQT